MTQQEALSILKTGSSVFLTGKPGSGKTYTINKYVEYLRSCGVEPAITASTGIAATHIGGFTVHSWSGIGVRRELSKYDINIIRQNKNIQKRVAGTHVLIIDEVSMLSNRTFSLIERICREVRQNEKPFGGLQIILVGDFFQLPPVSPRQEQSQTLLAGEDSREEFSYKSNAWSALNPSVCYLSEQHRQEDGIFLELLSSIRSKRVKERHKDVLRKRYGREPKENTTQLYPHNANVDALNNAELNKLGGQARVFEMRSSGPKQLIESLKRGCLSPETLALKNGARVMFTKNDTGRYRYVNGTLGVITGFQKENGYPIIKTRAGKTIFTESDEWRIEDGGHILARISQLPLRLAWAITVHKSQGMSLDEAHMDLSKTFEYGQGYVALSRVRTLAGLSLAGLNERALEVHPEVSAKDLEFLAQSKKTYQYLSVLNKKKLKAMQASFIKSCGGKFGAGQPSTRLKKEANSSTYDITHKLLKNDRTFSQIAKERGIKLGTVIGHAEKLVAEKKIDPSCDLAHIPKPKRFKKMRKALLAAHKKEGKILLSSARALLDESYNYDDLRLARLFL